MNIVTIDASCEAEGHPTDCTEIVSGTVQSTRSHNITITDSSGQSREVATAVTADMHFDEHAHDYIEDNPDGEDCHNNQSHDIDPEDDAMANITINGSKVYLVDDAVTTDPISGGNVNIIDSGTNNAITYTKQ